MGQVTVYLPDDLEAELRAAARKSGRSVSSLLADLARAKLRPARLDDDFLELFGSWEGDFPIPDDPPPDEVQFLVSEEKRTRRRR